MDVYTYIKKSNENLRNAIHKAYGKKCFYCGEKINMNQLEVDHIIPISDTEKPTTTEMEDYFKELEENNFIKDCIANYLPACTHCNRQKGDQYLAVGNLRYYHEQTIRHSNKVLKLMEKYKYAKEDPKKERELEALSKGKDYIQKKTISETPHACVYAYGLGSVRVNAFLPMKIKDELACLILFKQNGLTDCNLSLDESDIRTYFFEGYKTGVTTSRNYIWYIDNDVFAIKLPNNRFISDFDTAEQLSIIFDDLYDEYYKRKEVLLNTVGATYFEEVNKGEFLLLSLPKDIWLDMVDFAQEHDHFIGDSGWDIFKPLNLVDKDHIMIYKNHLDNTKADVLAELYVEDLSGSYVNVVWKAGHTFHFRDMEGFDNKSKWKADYTHDWILNEFVPYLIYFNTPDDRNLLQRIYKKKFSLEEFKADFNYREFGVFSRSLNEPVD